MRQCKAIIAPAQLLYSGKVATMQPYPSNSEQDVLVLQAFLDSYEQNAVGNEDKALDEETGEFELVRQVPESNNLLRQYSQPFLDCSSCCTHSRPHQRQSARACQVCLWLFIPKWQDRCWFKWQNDHRLSWSRCWGQSWSGPHAYPLGRSRKRLFCLCGMCAFFNSTTLSYLHQESYGHQATRNTVPFRHISEGYSSRLLWMRQEHLIWANNAFIVWP